MSVSRHRAKRSRRQGISGFDPENVVPPLAASGEAVPPDRLRERESRVFSLRPHWLGVIWPIVTTILVIILMGVAISMVPDDLPGQVFIRWALFVIGVMVLVGYSLRRVVLWVTSEFVLTSERLIHRFGWLTRRSVEIPLDQIADVVWSQHLLQRLAGVGDVVVESTGATGFAQLASIERPMHVHRAIYELLERHRAATNGQVPGRGDPIDQIERLAALRERGLISEEDYESAAHRLLKKL